MAVGTDRKHLTGRPASRIEHQAESGNRPRTGGVARAFLETPELLAREGVVSIRRLLAQADQQGILPDRDDDRRGERLAEVPVVLDLPVRRQVLEIDRAFSPPHVLAGVLVERNDKLMVAAV